MELKMKHLVASMAVLCLVAVPEAMAQRSSSPRIRDLVRASAPLNNALSGQTNPPISSAPVDPVYAPGAMSMAPTGTLESVPAGLAEPMPTGPAEPMPTGPAEPMPTGPAEPTPTGPVYPSTAAPTPGPQEGGGVTDGPAFGDLGGQWGVFQPPTYPDGLSSVAPCCEICGGGADCPDIWTIRNSVRYLYRSRPRRITIAGIGEYVNVTDADGNVTQQFTAPTVFTTRHGSFDVGPGYGVTVRRYWRGAKENSDLYVEAVYFGMNHWRQHRAVTATARLFTSYTDNDGNARFAGYGNLFTPFTSVADGPTTGFPGFDRADYQQSVFESTIHNLELNLRVARRSRPDRIVLHPNGRWRRECQPGIYGTSLFGIRYFSLQERFELLGTGTTDVYDVDGNLLYSVDSTGTYNVRTVNDMLGIQFGMELMYRRCLWGWGAEAKVAPCINFARQRSQVISTSTDPGDPFSAGVYEDRAGVRDQLALVGDVSVMVYYKVRPHITLRASWDMMWAVGVASAPEQLQFEVDPVSRVNNHGTELYQGASLGIEWTR